MAECTRRTLCSLNCVCAACLCPSRNLLAQLQLTSAGDSGAAETHNPVASAAPMHMAVAKFVSNLRSTTWSPMSCHNELPGQW
jgi:hypothetical protein